VNTRPPSLAAAPANPLRAAAAGRRVVLGHDWLTGMRGGERVLEHLCEAFPEAPLVTLLAVPAAVSGIIRDRPLHCSRLQRLPGVARHYRHLLPLMPLAASTLRVPSGDLLLTTSHCVAKSFRPPSGMRHLCYCFTPMRYAWLFRREYLGPVKSLLAAPLLAALRRWDARTAARVDSFVAISRHVQERIARFYGRESDVVHPPVDTGRFSPAPAGNGAGEYDLIVSALTPYKRIDLALRAYRKLDMPLKIVGTGTEARRLRALAGARTEFLGWRGDDELPALYRGCRLLVFPGEEDFGIVPLEAMACGRPVVAFARGGALETVREDVSGVFFREASAEALAEAVARAAARRWDRTAIRAQAERFGTARFLEEMAACVRRACAG
jgi:glycosyltransferase involved in cell wall biosynthesis